ncbi:MAG: AAA family ATPase [Gemmatimonadaceae bacterium]|nr:AAA family ATPase [Gemmatimonadaceae bacterium]
MSPRPAEIAPITRIVDRIDRISEGAAPTGLIPTGFPTLTAVLGGGFRRGDLVVVGGDVGVGTTSFGLAGALRAAQAGAASVFVSGEFTIERVHERALAMESRVRLDTIRQATCSDEERAQLATTAISLRDLPFAVTLIGTSGVADVARALGGRAGTAMLVVDGLPALVGAKGALPLAEEQARAMVALKRLAIEQDVALLVTAKLPALDRTRADRRPRLEDFGTLRAVEEQADVVLGLYREELYVRDLGIAGATELSLLKQRDGVTTYLDLYFFGPILRFEDMVDR